MIVLFVDVVKVNSFKLTVSFDNETKAMLEAKTHKVYFMATTQYPKEKADIEYPYYFRYNVNGKPKELPRGQKTPIDMTPMINLNTTNLIEGSFTLSYSQRFTLLIAIVKELTLDEMILRMPVRTEEEIISDRILD